ncbi:MAG: ribulose-phosphate 3-epimerase [Epsilonproteobacteria bacterium]|nr:ribulose-phosphate 3-epimerase [Campylobacterota bacterium]
MLISPSLLSADFSDIKSEIRKIELGGADLIHIDIMDGHFVPNLTVGPDFVRAVKKTASLPLDLHLMVTDPEKWIVPFYEAGASYITIHQEATPHLDRIIEKVNSLGIKSGLSLCPATAEKTLEYLLEKVDIVLVMSVNPGFGGQRFISNQIKKIRRLDKIRKKDQLSYMIEVDGGVNCSNAGELNSAGVDILVAGSFIFSSDDYKEAIESLRG